MSNLSHLFEPNWFNLKITNAVGAVAIATLAIYWFLLLRNRRKDIYSPDVLVAEMYGPDDNERNDETAIDAYSDAARRPRTSIVQKNRTRVVLVSVLTLAVAGASYGTSLHSYIILSNWSDGQQRDFIGDHPGAMICYKKALRVAPKLAKTHQLMGESLLKAGKLRAALTELAAAAKDSTDDPTAAWEMGDAYNMLNQPMNAAIAYKEALRISPRNAQYEIALAAAYERCRKFNDAYTCYERAIDDEPNNAKAYVKFGYLLMSQGMVDAGLAHLRRAVAIAPAYAIAHNTLGACYYQSGQYDDAIKEYKRSIELDPKSPFAQYDLALILLKLHQAPAALKYFKSCADLTPEGMADLNVIRMAKRQIEVLGQQ